ncbi:MAG TPA: hypothetical protein VNH46_11610 [Gemmatimonadales bacterium]|nr:hypothetical protein [Gemmatimonadales bacterium]
MTTHSLSRLALAAMGLLCLPTRLVSAQAAPPVHATPDWEPITSVGATRAAAAVESVFVDRDLARTAVAGGDFAAYLLTRLGMPVIPEDFHYSVSVDPQLIRIGGRIADLPADARQALAQLVFLLPPQTRLEGQVELQPAGPGAVRFHLRGATVQGIPVPETVLRPMLANVGRQYPALTDTGRDLLVPVPRGARVGLLPGAIELTGP